MALPRVNQCPISPDRLRCRTSRRGTLIEIDLADASHVEQFYGLGLQLESLNQTGRKRTLRVNSDPRGDAGDSHAPVPLIVSTAGYGIYIDTARYATFYLGSYVPLRSDEQTQHAKAAASNDIADNTQQLYAQRSISQRIIGVEIPIAAGVDIYIFAGPTPLNVVQRYNLFSGGGCLPALWGLGIWYRAYGRASQSEILALARSLRDACMPCDVFGLEPGWQSRAYSCSFVWNPQLFPQPEKLLRELRDLNFEVNLWEHAFTHPESPLYPALFPFAGDCQVWGGLVPDFSNPTAREIFTDYHRAHFVDRGVTGFKLDECDNSDFITQSSWSFPESSQFPSGLDGEQMHSLFGLLYQRTINEALEPADVRTFSLVRSSGAFAAPLPFVLYSDLYNHRDFIRGVATSSFTGLLWSPEVRNADSSEDLLRRIETAILSPLAMINAWYIKNPPWLQFDRDKNNADELLDDAGQLQSSVRQLLQLRMSLVPYLYAAYARYHFKGIPPFRALLLDYPSDSSTYGIDDQYLIGDELLAAPAIAGQRERNVYLPTGDWYHFFTHQRFTGGRSYAFPVVDGAPLLFARGGAIIPWADPVQHITPQTVFDVTAHAFGPPSELRPTTLIEDDGVTFAFRRGIFNRVTLRPDGSLHRSGSSSPHRYRLVAWKYW